MANENAAKVTVGTRVVWTGMDGPIYGTVTRIPGEHEGHYGLAFIHCDDGEDADASLSLEGYLLPGSMWKLA